MVMAGLQTGAFLMVLLDYFGVSRFLVYSVQSGDHFMSATSRIPLLDRDAAAPDSQKIYDALLAARGVVPNMFKVLGYRPEIAQGVAGFLKPLLADGALPGFYKELVAVRISHLNVSAYAIRAHSIS